MVLLLLLSLLLSEFQEVRSDSACAKTSVPERTRNRRKRQLAGRGGGGGTSRGIEAGSGVLSSSARMDGKVKFFGRVRESPCRRCAMLSGGSMDEDRKGYATVGSDDNRDQLTMPIALREISNLSRVRKNRGGCTGGKEVVRNQFQPKPKKKRNEQRASTQLPRQAVNKTIPDEKGKSDSVNGGQRFSRLPRGGKKRRGSRVAETRS